MGNVGRRAVPFPVALVASAGSPRHQARCSRYAANPRLRSIDWWAFVAAAKTLVQGRTQTAGRQTKGACVTRRQLHGVVLLEPTTGCEPPNRSARRTCFTL